MVRWLILAVWLWPVTAWAELGSLFDGGAAPVPLIALATVDMGERGGIFDDRAVRPLLDRGSGVQMRDGLAGGDRIARLFDLIAGAEAGAAQYDAVHHGARVRPPGPPTALSVGQVLDWIVATPGQPHAIGRYQFIPATLRRLLRDQDVPRTARFTPALQDSLARQLLREADLEAFRSGEIGRTAFMNNLAKIWAGLPNSSGRSHYHGHAGNRATMSWRRFEEAMQQLFPASRA